MWPADEPRKRIERGCDRVEETGIAARLALDHPPAESERSLAGGSDHCNAGPRSLPGRCRSRLFDAVRPATGLFGGEWLGRFDGSDTADPAVTHRHHSVSNLGHVATRRSREGRVHLPERFFGAAE